MAKINVKHIAKLAELSLTEEEEKKFESQLSAVLEHIEKLSEVDTSNTPETDHVTGLVNVTREDSPMPSLPQEKALEDAKKTYNGFFIVPGVLTGE